MTRAWYRAYSREHWLFTYGKNCAKMATSEQSLEAAVTHRQRRQIVDLVVAQMVVSNDEDVERI